ncbi:hypothetical protein BDV19DRAFT_352834 [Aspergillus venezuelensis]
MNWPKTRVTSQVGGRTQLLSLFVICACPDFLTSRSPPSPSLTPLWPSDNGDISLVYVRFSRASSTTGEL